MKFRDFLLRNLITETDFLVGYDENGNYIRINKNGLVQSLVAEVPVPELVVQYSTNGSAWHNDYVVGDKLMRIKVGSGNWSAPIRICVSAYDIWLAQGNTGSEADFLASLQGADGASASVVRLSELEGYAELLAQVNNTVTNAKSEIIGDVTATATANVMEQFKQTQMEELQEVKSLSDEDYLTIVTADGLKRVSLGSLTANVAVKTVTSTSAEKTMMTQSQVLKVTGLQNGENIEYRVDKAYIAGTSNLYLNGQRLVLGVDYKENGEAAAFVMLTYVPIDTDSIIFIAVAK